MIIVVEIVGKVFFRAVSVLNDIVLCTVRNASVIEANKNYEKKLGNQCQQQENKDGNTKNPILLKTKRRMILGSGIFLQKTNNKPTHIIFNHDY